MRSVEVFQLGARWMRNGELPALGSEVRCVPGEHDIILSHMRVSFSDFGLKKTLKKKKKVAAIQLERFCCILLARSK